MACGSHGTLKGNGGYPNSLKQVCNTRYLTGKALKFLITNTLILKDFSKEALSQQSLRTSSRHPRPLPPPPQIWRGAS